MNDELTPNQTKKPSKKKRCIILLILCAAVIAAAVTCALVHQKKEAEKKAKEAATAETNVLTDSYKETAKDKKQIKAMQAGFPKITIGMSTQDMLKAVGVDYDSKSTVTVQDVSCTQYSWSAGENRYVLGVIVNNNAVVGKTQSGLFTPKDKIQISDLEALGDNPKRSDVEAKLGKGVLVSSVEIPDKDTQNVVLYGSTSGGVWLVIYNKDVLYSCTGIAKSSNVYQQNCTEKVKELQ